MKRSILFSLFFVLIFSLSSCAKSGDNTVDIESILQRARMKDKDAYKELAECYRYGRGVDKSIVNALQYYGEAGVRVDSIAKASASDPADEFAAYFNVVDGIVKMKLSQSEIIAAVSRMPEPRPAWASMILEAMKLDSRTRPEFILDHISEKSTADELMTATIILMVSGDESAETAIQDKLLGDSKDEMKVTRIMGEKMPMYYAGEAFMYWRKYIEDPENQAGQLANAFECMYKADRAALLSTYDMANILNYVDKHGKPADFPFSDEDLARFRTLCPPDLRESSLSPATIEEFVPADSPDEIIEEPTE